MDKRIKQIIAALLFLGALTWVAMACPVSVECPVHAYSIGYFIRNDVIDGVTVGVYRCPYSGHTFIVRCQ